MKKFLILVLSLIMVVSLIGCSNETAKPEEPAKPAEPADPAKPAEPAAPKIDFPTKSMTLIVPYAAGGSSDMSARPLADQLSTILGQPMVVENRPGAGGAIGTAEVVRSKADGYTLLNASIGGMTIVPYTQDVGYTYENLRAVAQATDIPLSLAVHKNSPFQTLDDFIAYAKENPGKLQVGNPGAGNIQHVAMSHISNIADIEVTDVPYEGANPAVAALLGEHIDAIFTGITEQLPHYNEGTFKILAMTGKERNEKLMPDVPTFTELGYDAVFGVWYGIVAPKDTPDEVVELLDEAVKEALKSEDVIKSMENLNLIISYLNHEDFDKRIANDAATNQQILKDLGMAK